MVESLKSFRVLSDNEFSQQIRVEIITNIRKYIDLWDYKYELQDHYGEEFFGRKFYDNITSWCKRHNISMVMYNMS